MTSSTSQGTILSTGAYLFAKPTRGAHGLTLALDTALSVLASQMPFSLTPTAVAHSSNCCCFFFFFFLCPIFSSSSSSSLSEGADAESPGLSESQVSALLIGTSTA